MTLFIFEGMNGTGKTTVINQMQDKLHFNTLRRFADWDNTIMDKTLIKIINQIRIQTILDMFQTTNASFILDRFVISEKIFGMFHRSYDISYLAYIYSQLNKHKNVITILLTCDSKVAIKRLKDRTKQPKEMNIKHYDALQSEFIHLTKLYAKNHLIIDTTDKTINDIYNIIIQEYLK